MKIVTTIDQSIQAAAKALTRNLARRRNPVDGLIAFPVVIFTITVYEVLLYSECITAAVPYLALDRRRGTEESCLIDR
jgi:hypothetical protein